MDAITSFDFSILNFIQENYRCVFLDVFLGFISRAGEAGIIWIIFSVIMLFFKKTRTAGFIALLSMGAGYFFGDIIIKHIVNRPRPFTVDSELNMFRNTSLLIEEPNSSSFPSGHSLVAAAFTTTLLIKQRTFGLIAIPLALIMMFSRLYNYVHYPTDVLCGAVFGVATAFLIVFIVKKTPLESKLESIGSREKQ